MTEKKDEMIGFNVSAEDKVRIREVAISEHLTLGAFVRRAVMLAVDGYGGRNRVPVLLNVGLIEKYAIYGCAERQGMTVEEYCLQAVQSAVREDMTL